MPIFGNPEVEMFAAAKCSTEDADGHKTSKEPRLYRQ